ncbi:MAG: hypothetical protein ACKO5E_04750, partial [bacterium]
MQFPAFLRCLPFCLSVSCFRFRRFGHPGKRKRGLFQSPVVNFYCPRITDLTASPTSLVELLPPRS